MFGYTHNIPWFLLLLVFAFVHVIALFTLVGVAVAHPSSPSSIIPTR